MRIGTLAAETGLSRDTLRFYEQRGLIRSTRSENSYRTYAPETVQLLAYIRTAQRLGFSLAEIGESLPALWNSATPDEAIAALLLEKVAVIDQKIEELSILKKDLLERVAQNCPLSATGSTLHAAAPSLQTPNSSIAHGVAKQSKPPSQRYSRAG